MPNAPKKATPSASSALARVRANNSLLNLFTDYLPLSLHLLDPADTATWYALVPGVSGLHPVQFEIYFKALKSRYAFHQRQIHAVLKSKRPAEAAHHGIWDCFSPAGPGVLIAGAYLTAMPDETQLRAQFNAIRRKARADEALFVAYARSVIETPVLSPKARRALSEVMAFAASWLFEGRGQDAETLESLKPLFAAELPQRAERFAESRREKLLLWAAQAQGVAAWDRRDFGIRALPASVIAVSLALTNQDAVAGMLQAARLRRLAFELAVERNWICGRSAGEGACLLLPPGAMNDALIRELQGQLSKALGAAVSIGASLPLNGETLPEAFRQAEWALLMGLQKGERLFKYQSSSGGSSAAIGAWEAGRRLIAALLAGHRAELNAARDAALGNMNRLFPGRADLLRPQLLQLLLELFDSLKHRNLIEAADFESQRRDALGRLENAGSARALIAEFGASIDALLALASSPRGAGSRSRVRAARQALLNDGGQADLLSSARLSGVSPSRFSRLFKSESGEGFAEARRRERLEAARLLLQQGQMPIWRVAQECGYRSASHFTQVFQSQFGSTPTRWRQANSK